ncbi:MAG: hypothetical protein AAF614_04220 [Chloroflexota bacterium]
MKTAISIPDTIFEAAEQLATRLGVSRSELYATAVSEYLASFDQQAITDALNDVYAVEESHVDPVLYEMTFHTLEAEDWT